MQIQIHTKNRIEIQNPEFQIAESTIAFQIQIVYSDRGFHFKITDSKSRVSFGIQTSYSYYRIRDSEFRIQIKAPDLGIRNSNSRSTF